MIDPKTLLSRMGVLVFAFVGASVWANTITVNNNTSDPAAGAAINCAVGNANTCTLRDAFAAAASNDTVVFAPALDGATIALTQYTNCLTTSDTGSTHCLPLATWPTINGVPQVTQFGPSAFFVAGKTLTIDASANNLVHGVVLDATTANTNCGPGTCFRLFDIDPTGNLTLQGLTLKGGKVKGGSGPAGGSALGAGGAIFNQGTLTVQRCTLSGNIAAGGDITGVGGLITGGGVGQSTTSVAGGGPNGGASFGANGGFGGGGGDGSSKGGFGGGGGGNGGFGGGGGNGSVGGFAGGSGSVLGGGGGGLGGAIFNDAGSVSLTNVTVAGNIASGGNSNSFGGNGSGYGGALFNYNGTLTLDFVTLSGNIVAAGTGGSGGSADGGVIYSLSDGNCTTDGSGASGGNLCASNNASLTINDSIVENSSGSTSEVVIDRRNVSATNPASSTETNDRSYIASSLVVAGSGGIINSTNPITTAPTVPTSISSGGGFDAVLVPPAGSSAIDAVPCNPAITKDQRGVPRPQGSTCDIGAVEVIEGLLQVSVTTLGGSVSAGSPPVANSAAISGCVEGGSTCSAYYTIPPDVMSAQSVLLTASPTASHFFAGWTGDGVVSSECTGTSASTSVTMSQARSCSARFLPMSMTFSATPSSTVVNGNITLLATFAGNAPTGTVAFSETAPALTTLCASAALMKNGNGTFSATCTLTAPPSGSYTAAATYAGDAANGSDSAMTSFTVSQAATTTSIAVKPPGPITLGSSVTVSATAAANPSGPVSPTGTITVTDGGTGTGDSCTIAIAATDCTLTPSSIGEKTITAAYNGDSNFTGSNVSAPALSVTPPSHLVSAASNGNGGVAPASQYITDGNTAHITLTPNGGYAATAFGGSCPPGMLSGNNYITGAVTADCSVTVTFTQATLTLSVTDHHSYARYGSEVMYEITLSNSSGTDISGVSISGTAPSGLDLPNGRWQCDGLHCTQSGNGPFTDSAVTIPVGASTTWAVTIPVLENAPGASIDYTVSVTGAGGIAPQADSDILVIFHDGFNVPYADGAQ